MTITYDPMAMAHLVVELMGQSPSKTVLSRRDFYRLFTKAQVLQIAQLRLTDPNVAYYMGLLEQGPHVDLRHDETTEGLAALIAADVLTMDDAARIVRATRPENKG